MADQPVTWLFSGDSITQGVFHTHGGRSWVEHVHERLRWLDDPVHPSAAGHRHMADTVLSSLGLGPLGDRA